MSMTFNWNGNIDITGKFLQNGEELSNSSTGGKSISKIEFTESSIGATTAGTAGSTDLYTITFTDNTTTTFSIYNGVDGEKGETGEQGPQGEKGEDGDTISGFSFIESSNPDDYTTPNQPGYLDTYSFSMNDGTEFRFDVYNGADGSSGSSAGMPEVSITVSETGTDDETLNIYQNPIYATVAFALERAAAEGVQNLIINLEGDISETIDVFYYTGNYIKFYRQDEVNFGTNDYSTYLTFNGFDVDNGLTVIFELSNLHISFYNYEYNINRITNFGKVIISGSAANATSSDINSNIEMRGESPFYVNNGGTFVVKNCYLQANENTYLDISDGARCALSNVDWDDTSNLQGSIAVSNGGILTSSTTETQNYLKNEGTNSGLVIINNQIIPH